MIGQLAAAAMSAAQTLARRVDFGFGPPTKHFNKLVFGQGSFEPGQAGLSVKWSGDDGGLATQWRAGPFEFYLNIGGFDASILDPEVNLARRWVIVSEDGSVHTLHAALMPAHLGVLLETGQFTRLTVGPLCFIVEPGANPA